MQTNDLKKTTLDPAKRRLLRVTAVDIAETDRVLGELMGEDVRRASSSSWNAPRRPTSIPTGLRWV